MIKIQEIKSIITLSLPLMAAFLGQRSMQFIDTYMMGWIGPEALAAGVVGTSLFFVFLLFCMGTLSAVGIFIIRAKGANDIQDIHSSLKHGLYIAVFLSLPCMLMIWFSPSILFALGEDPAVVRNTIVFLHGLIWGLPGFLLFLVLRDFIAAFSLTRMVMYVTLGSIPLTFIGNYLFIYGQYGFPALGIAGIGYASAIVMWFMFLALWFYSRRHPQLRNYLYFKPTLPDYRKIKNMLSIGLPSGVLLVLESGTFFVAVLFMGYFGKETLAAHQVAMQCLNFVYSIQFALAMTTSLQIAQAIGAKNILQARRSAILGLIIGLIISILIAIVFILIPEQLIKIFINNDENHYQIIAPLATSFLIIAGLFQYFDGLQAMANAALKGLKDTFIPMLLSIGCYWLIGIGSAYYFAFYTSLAATGIWYGLTLGFLITGMVLIWRLFRLLKNEKNLYHHRSYFHPDNFNVIDEKEQQSA